MSTHPIDWRATMLIEELRRAGVEIVFLNRPLRQSPEDDLLLQVQGIVSEYERAKIMERSRRGKKHAAQRGSLNVMSNAPYGYRYITVHDGEGQARFEPVPDQVDVVRNIFTWVGRERCTLGEVCRRLQDGGNLTAHLVPASRMAHSPKSCLSGDCGVRQNPYDATYEEVPLATAPWPTG
jgi:hypothetical protein